MEFTKVYNDPIHSSIQMPKYCQMIIDTPEFQNFRYTKMLGCTYLVFPSAVHSRFEHSLGVSHLAGKLATMLQQHSRNSKTPIQDIEVTCVQIAGLCHDLGHGPFSHAFEGIVPPDKDGKKWTHEKQSVIMFKYLIEHNGLKKKLEAHSIYQSDLDFICELIQGGAKEESTKLLRENKFYLYQIVNNSANGVDVDKWDYFARDTHYLGMKSAFDFNRIMPFVKVFKVTRGSETRKELCFRDKVASDLNEMFLTRRRLHYTCYQHRVTKVITIMMMDVLLAAADHLKIEGENGLEYNLLESVKDPMAFSQVNDTIVNEIMRSRSQEPGMRKARGILDRIHKRNLYKCIGECQHANEVMCTVDPTEIKQWIVNDDDISSLSSSLSKEIWQVDNIEIEVSHFDYGSGETKDRNPLLDIPFYKKSRDGTFKAELMPEDKLPAFLPQRLKDVTIRIYTKVPDLDRLTLDEARSRCKDMLEQHYLKNRSTPVPPSGGEHGTGTTSPSLIGAVSPLNGSSGSTQGLQGLILNPPDADAGTVSDESRPGVLRSREPEASVNPVARK